jgi:hypothetical protein
MPKLWVDNFRKPNDQIGIVNMVEACNLGTKMNLLNGSRPFNKPKQTGHSKAESNSELAVVWPIGRIPWPAGLIIAAAIAW